MFERRLKVLLLLMAVPAAGVVARLFHLQVVEADYYLEAGRRMVSRPPSYLPSLRGDIQDHEGRRLAYDAPAWDIGVKYQVLAEDPAYLAALARQHSPEAVADSWQAIARLTRTPVEELLARREVIVRRVRRIKDDVVRRRIQRMRGKVLDPESVEVVIPEELSAHPIVRGLSQNEQAIARVELAAYPWVEVLAGHVRRYEGGESLGHLLGYLNEVNAKDKETDPLRDDELAAYRDGDLHGAAGVEALAEQTLRGKRGLRSETEAGPDITEPVNGRNFRLTIDLALQQAVYARLAETVKANPLATGGSAVVLDVPSRQVLALVSYPGYDPNVTHQERRRLLADALHRPLSFRAVGEDYQPGSTVKPIVLTGAMSDGTVNAQTHYLCAGRLFADSPGWRCLGHHGDVGPIAAIQKSCNIFFYHVGQEMTVARIVWWMSQAGFGRPTGTGLMEEAPGSLPTTGGRGDARNTAIGQWDVRITPIQAANMVASIAAGAYRPVTLWADDPRPRPPVPLPATREALRTVREGMYRAVNEAGGTGHAHIHLTNAGDLVLLGKTGSAEATVGPVVEWIFTCRFPDGSADEIIAANRTDLLLRHPAATIVESRPFRRYPTEDMDPTHAWFVGYLTSRGRYLESSAGGKLNVAVAVLIEYGGRGGGVAAPLGGEIVQLLIDMQDPAK